MHCVNGVDEHDFDHKITPTEMYIALITQHSVTPNKH